MTSPAPQTPKNSNKLWLWLALGGCGGLLLLGGLVIAAIVGGAAWFLFSELNVSLNPEAAEELAASMMAYDIPGDESGIVSSTDFFGAEVAVMQSINTDDTTTLMLGKVPPAAQENWGTQPEDFLELFTGEEVLAVTEIRVDSSSTESRSLCDETASVRLSEGTEEITNQPATVYEAVVIKEDFVYMAALTVAGPNHSAIANQVFDSLACR